MTFRNRSKKILSTGIIPSAACRKNPNTLTTRNILKITAVTALLVSKTSRARALRRIMGWRFWLLGGLNFDSAMN
jgi:hypothetical protein